MSLTKIFSSTSHGGMIILGNTLGLSGPRNDGQEIGSIGAFITSDLSKQVPTYPLGTTINWIENSSFAVVTIPTGATVLHAQLSWGGTEIANGAGNVTPFVDNSIWFTTPNSSNFIQPDTNLSESFSFTNGLNKYYSRSQDVTNLVSASGVYSVASVPAVVAPDVNGITCAGWALSIVYELASLPVRNMTLYAGIQGIDVTAPDIELYGFLSPSSGTVEGRILVSALEGDSGIVNDSLLFGPDSLNLLPLSGPNNLPTNFFSSQINIGDSQSPNVGYLDISGSFGNLNSTPGSFPPHGVRQGFDVTNVLSSNFTHSQRSAVLRITSTGDAYAATSIGLQLDAVIPNPFNCSSYGYRVAVPNGDSYSELTQVNLVTGENVVINPNLGFNINAIGYSTLDNFIYGMKSNSTDLLLIDKDGAVINYGPIPNLPVASYDVGAVDNLGHLFIKNSLSQTYYVVDVNQNSPTFGTLLDSNGTNLSEMIPMSDWTFRKNDMQLYGVNQNDGQLVSINPLNGIVSHYTTTGLPISAYGSMYSLADDFIYAVSNNTGYIYRISILGSSATALYFSKDIISSQNDGASCLNATLNLDFGDAPDTSNTNNTDDYSTLLENNGPRHLIITNLTLGSKITSEIDAHQNSNATGDDLTTIPNIIDDGIITPLPSLITVATDYTVDVTVNNDTNKNANLYSWVDFNQNGVFETDEGFTTIVPSSSLPQVITMTFTRPSGFTTVDTHTFLRVRLTTDTLINTGSPLTQDTRSIGPAGDGEVEDYIINVLAVPPNCPMPSTIYANMNTPYSGTVIATDPQNQILSYSIKTQPMNGTLNLSSFTGNYLYTPNNNYLGDDSFEILATNSSGLSCSLIILVKVVSAILNLEKTVNTDITAVPSILTYDITVTNNGNTDALGVTISDLLQAETSYIPNTLLVDYLPSTDLPSTGIYVGTISAGFSSLIQFDVNVNSYPSNYKIENTPTGTFEYIVTPLSLPVLSDTIGNTTTVTVANPSLKIDKLVTTHFASINEIVTYLLYVENNGTINLNNVIVKDIVPNGLNYIDNTLTVEGVETGENPNTGIYLNTLLPKDIVTIIFNAIVTSIPDPNPAINTASATFNYKLSPTSESIPGSSLSNNVSTEVRFADLVSPGNFVKSGDKKLSTLGDTITYTLVIQNTGNTVAQNVTITDVVPGSTSYVPSSLVVNDIPSSYIPSTGIYVGDIDIDEIIIIRFKVAVTSTSPNSQIDNVASLVYTYKKDPLGIDIPENSTSNIFTTYLAKPEIYGEKYSDKNAVKVGQTFNYTINVKNTGNTILNNVLIIDTLPSVFSVSTITGNIISGNLNNGVIVGSLAVNQSKSINVEVLVLGEPTPNPYINTADFKGSAFINPDVTLIDVYNYALTPLGLKVYNPTTTLTKTADTNYATVGETIHYTIKIENNGNLSLYNMVVNDLLPIDLEFVKYSVIVDSIPNKNLSIINGISLGTVLPNEYHIIEFDALVVSNLNDISVNIAKSTYEYHLPNDNKTYFGTNISNSHILNISESINNLEIIKSSNKTIVSSGETLTFTIDITNKGENDIIKAILKDDLNQCFLELIKDSFIINSTRTIVDAVNLFKGIDIGPIPVQSTTTVKFDVKIKSTNCFYDKFYSIFNKAIINATYILADDSIVVESKDSNTVVINHIAK